MEFFLLFFSREDNLLKFLSSMNYLFYLIMKVLKSMKSLLHNF